MNANPAVTDRAGLPGARQALLRLLVCPTCRGELTPGDAQLACPACARAYPLREGLPCFDQSDPFYDAYADEHAPYGVSPAGLKRHVLSLLPFWSWREWRFWKSAVPRCGRLLDCGAGRGKQVFVERARETVGFDASWSFVSACAEHYDLAVQGTLPRLPFHDAAFDVLVSSHLFGHVPAEAKDELIAETARVLRSGGRAAHLIETDSAHPLVRAAKRRPELYRKQFVEQDGHVGLEPAERVVARFSARGFRVRGLRLVEALVPSRQNFEKYLDHPGFREELPGFTWLERATRLSRAHPLLNLAYEVGLGSFHFTLEQWLGRPSHAQFVMLTLDKP